MNKQVTITAHPTTGKVFTQMLNADNTPKLDKNGKPFGFIRVQSEEISLGFAYNNGAIKRRSALISMTVEAFEKSKAVLVNGAKANGQIVRKDSLTPAYEGQKPMETGGEDSKIITSGGQPVYRNEYFTESQNDADVKLESAYDKIEEVKATKAATVLAE